MSRQIDLKTVAKNFEAELKDAKNGRATSLPFIIHKLSTKPLVNLDEPFQVMAIGGTIFRKAIVEVTKSGLKFIERDQKYQPPFHSKNDFDKFIEAEISPKVNVIALNFAYPLKPVFKNGKLDGVLVNGGKENVFSNLIGREVGTEVEKLLFAKRKQKVKVAVANDTICLLLSGLDKSTPKELAAGVVGTGMNFAFFLSDGTAVNLESANFDKFPPSPETNLIDVNSANPKKSIFEKEVSGAYLYKHFNLIAQSKNIGHSPLASTQDLDKLAHSTTAAAKIAKDLLANSASLVAAQIAGILNFKNRDMAFVIEGSLFWLSDGYRQNVKKILAEICPQYKAKFLKVADSTLVGATHLVV